VILEKTHQKRGKAILRGRGGHTLRAQKQRKGSFVSPPGGGKSKCEKGNHALLFWQQKRKAMAKTGKVTSKMFLNERFKRKSKTKRDPQLATVHEGNTRQLQELSLAQRES